jgi:hypothetical protein
MRYPCLVPPSLCRVPVTVHLESEEITNLGEPQYVVDIPEIKCNYQDKARTIYTAEKKVVQITGTALLPGDIAPDMPTLPGGTVVVFGVERRIAQGQKNRNPDGTVNYCTLWVV